jgi:predicted MFS family arabinose efflux permease
MPSPASKLRSWRSCLFAEGLSGFAVDGGIYAVLFNLYLLRLGYGPTFIGTINAAGLLTFGLASLPAGLMGGRWGCRRMIMLGLGMMAAGCTALPLAEFTPPAWQAHWLVATYVVIHLGLALHISNATPVVVAGTNIAERHRAFALLSALWFLAGFVGNLFGGWVPALLGYRSTLALAGLCLLPAIVVMWFARDTGGSATLEPLQKRERVPYTRIGWLALARLLQVAGAGAVFLFLNVYLDKGLGAQLSGTGTLLAVGRLGAVPVALLAPLLLSRWDKRSLIIAATSGIALSLMPVAFVPHWSAALLSFMGVVALTAVRIPAFLVYSMEAVAPEHRALMSGANEMANGLGFAIIGLGGGHIITAFGYRPLFLLSACLTAAGTLIFWWCCRDAKPANEIGGSATRAPQPAS